MLKRIVGLLIILSLLLAPFLAFGTIIVARAAADQLDSSVRLRFQNISGEIATMRGAVQPLVNTLAAVRGTLTQIKSALAVGITTLNQITPHITIPGITIPPITFPQRTINVPDIPSISLGSINVLGAEILLPTFPGFVTPDITFGPFTLSVPAVPPISVTIPGLASVVVLLRDGYALLEQTVQGVIDITGVEQIITSLGNMSAEVEALGTDVDNIQSELSEPIRWLGLGIAAWLVITWLALLATSFRYGWRLLTGQV